MQQPLPNYLRFPTHFRDAHTVFAALPCMVDRPSSFDSIRLRKPLIQHEGLRVIDCPGERIGMGQTMAPSLLESLRFRLSGKSEMQNNVIILCVVSVLRLLWSCASQLFRGVVLLRSSIGLWYFERAYFERGLGTFSLTADLDSARLDVVSRSLWWGSGAPVLKPVRAVARPLNATPRASRRHCVPPETFHRWDH